MFREERVQAQLGVCCMVLAAKLDLECVDIGDEGSTRKASPVLRDVGLRKGVVAPMQRISNLSDSVEFVSKGGCSSLDWRAGSRRPCRGGDRGQRRR